MGFLIRSFYFIFRKKMLHGQFFFFASECKSLSTSSFCGTDGSKALVLTPIRCIAARHDWPPTCFYRSFLGIFLLTAKSYRSKTQIYPSAFDLTGMLSRESVIFTGKLIQNILTS